MRLTTGATLLLTLLPVLAEAQIVAPRVGETRWIGEAYFQYLGQDDTQRDLWLYPHTDGVPEVFTVTPDGPWEGTLDSRYDPASGRFAERFNAAEILNELIAASTPRPRKKRAAKLLALFAALHPTEAGPYYLREHRRALKRHLSRKGRAWVQASARRLEGWLARVAEPGTRVHRSPAELSSSDDHYRALLADGYLDVAVVGGNSYDEATGKVLSWGMVEDLRLSLKRLGFQGARFRRASDRTICERTVRLLGRRARVRVQLTGGSANGARIRRAVANFVEGLANADVVIYLGHSNHGSGNYYLSESKSSFSRFRVGFGHRRDLNRKCHDLGRKAHQIVALQSCSSWQKYCRSMEDFFADQAQVQTPGFLGTTDVCYFEEFAPRYTELLSLLTAGAGPQALARRVNAIKFGERTPTLLLRGVLQPRDCFIVPRGVTIVAQQELGRDEAFVVMGTGSDGREYPSTGAFPQDRRGWIVQAVRRAKGLYGLSADGRLLTVDRETDGAVAELTAARDAGPLTFIGWAQRRGKRRLHAIDAAGRILTLSRDRTKLVTAKCQLTNARCVAVGNAPDDTFVAVDADGRQHAWEKGRRAWRVLEEPVVLEGITPSLKGPAPAQLWIAPR